MLPEKWFVYIVRCSDGTLYTGVTTDINRRLREHNGIVGTAKKGAKYTKIRRPVDLVYQELAVSRSAAQRRESIIKKLPRSEKEKMLGNKTPQS